MILRLMSGMAATVLVSTFGLQAHADDGAGVGSAENSFEAVAFSGQSAAPTSSAEGAVTEASTRTTYSYEPACATGEGISGDSFYGCGGRQKCGEKGHMFYVWAHSPGGGSENLGAQCFEQDEAPAAPTPQVTQALVLRAFQRIPVPASEVSIQPPGGKTLVNLETIFSTEAAEFTRTIGLLGHRVDLEIWPSRFEWVTGDGASFATDWAGRPWEKGVPMGEYITHNYADAEDVTTRVDTTWSARYRVDGGDWQDVGGTVTIDGEPFDLAVLSAAPHLVG
jgi:hypothetical protein